MTKRKPTMVRMAAIRPILNLIRANARPTIGRTRRPRSAKPLDARKYYGEMAMASLERRFDNEPGLVVISPATPGSNGITRDFRERAGAHYVDTGITEEHAAAFAAGIARAGGRPVLATSATFFQRTFDQLQQELALNPMFPPRC